MRPAENQPESAPENRPLNQRLIEVAQRVSSAEGQTSPEQRFVNMILPQVRMFDRENGGAREDTYYGDMRKLLREDPATMRQLWEAAQEGNAHTLTFIMSAVRDRLRSRSRTETGSSTPAGRNGAEGRFAGQNVVPAVVRGVQTWAGETLSGATTRPTGADAEAGRNRGRREFNPGQAASGHGTVRHYGAPDSTRAAKKGDERTDSSAA